MKGIRKECLTRSYWCSEEEVIDEVASKITTKQNVSHYSSSSARLKSEKSIKGREEGPKKRSSGSLNNYKISVRNYIIKDSKRKA